MEVKSRILLFSQAIQVFLKNLYGRQNERFLRRVADKRGLEAPPTVEKEHYDIPEAQKTTQCV